MEISDILNFLWMLLSILCQIGNLGEISPRFPDIFNLEDNLVETLCKKSTDPSFCVHALRFDPHSATANKEGFAQIAINLTELNATNTLQFVTIEMAGTTDPNLRAAYEHCSLDYQDIISKTYEANEFLSAREYYRVISDGVSIMAIASECSSHFSSLSPMSDRNKFVKLFGEMIVIIAEALIFK